MKVEVDVPPQSPVSTQELWESPVSTAQEPCESRSGRPGLPVPSKYGSGAV